MPNNNLVLNDRKVTSDCCTWTVNHHNNNNWHPNESYRNRFILWQKIGDNANNCNGYTNVTTLSTTNINSAAEEVGQNGKYNYAVFTPLSTNSLNYQHFLTLNSSKYEKDSKELLQRLNNSNNSWTDIYKLFTNLYNISNGHISRASKLNIDCWNVFCSLKTNAFTVEVRNDTLLELWNNTQNQLRSILSILKLSNKDIDYIERHGVTSFINETYKHSIITFRHDSNKNRVVIRIKPYKLTKSFFGEKYYFKPMHNKEIRFYTKNILETKAKLTLCEQNNFGHVNDIKSDVEYYIYPNSILENYKTRNGCLANESHNKGIMKIEWLNDDEIFAVSNNNNNLPRIMRALNENREEVGIVDSILLQDIVNSINGSNSSHSEQHLEGNYNEYNNIREVQSSTDEIAENENLQNHFNSVNSEIDSENSDDTLIVPMMRPNDTLDQHGERLWRIAQQIMMNSN